MSSVLYPTIYEFLAENGLNKAAKALLLEANLGSKPPAGDKDVLQLLKNQATVVAGKRKRENGNGAAGPPAKKPAAAAASSDDDSDSDGTQRCTKARCSQDVFSCS